MYRECEAKRTEGKTRKNVFRATKFMFSLHALDPRAITAILLPLLTIFLRKGSFPMRDVPGASFAAASRPMLDLDCWNNGGGGRGYGDRGAEIAATVV